MFSTGQGSEDVQHSLGYNDTSHSRALSAHRPRIQHRGQTETLLNGYTLRPRLSCSLGPLAPGICRSADLQAPVHPPQHGEAEVELPRCSYPRKRRPCATSPAGLLQSSHASAPCTRNKHVSSWETGARAWTDWFRPGPWKRMGERAVPAPSTVGDSCRQRNKLRFSGCCWISCSAVMTGKQHKCAVFAYRNSGCDLAYAVRASPNASHVGYQSTFDARNDALTDHNRCCNRKMITSTQVNVFHFPPHTLGQRQLFSWVRR